MKTLHTPLAITRILPWVLLAATTACSNPMPCPGEIGAPVDEYGNEVDPAHNPNIRPRLNTDCYYGRSSNGRIVLLTQKPQTGFWNSSVYRSDQQVPMNPAIIPMNPQVMPPQPPMPPQPQQMPMNQSGIRLEKPVTSTSIEPLIASDAPLPLSPAPYASVQPAPSNQKLYYRAGKAEGKCGVMNVYREAHLPPCPVASPAPPPPPAPIIVQQNYPPVAVETGVAPAQAAGAFLGGVGEDLIGAGALTYAIRYRPDRISNDSSSSSNPNVSADASSTADANASATSKILNDGFLHKHDHGHHHGGSGYGGSGGGWRHGPKGGGQEGYGYKHEGGEHHDYHKGSEYSMKESGYNTHAGQSNQDSNSSMLSTLEKW